MVSVSESLTGNISAINGNISHLCLVKFHCTNDCNNHQKEKTTAEISFGS